MKLFSGSSNPILTQKIADILKIPVAQSELVTFANSEIRVRIIEDVSDETCVIVQSTDNPTDSHLMELFFFADALKRQNAAKVIAMIPYFGYARQDIQHRPGEAVSANVIVRFIEAIGFNEVLTFDIHDEATAGVFNIPFRNLTTMDILADVIKRYLNDDKKIAVNPDNIAVVSPDQGAIEKIRNFGSFLFGSDDFPLAVTEKKRDQEHIHQAHPYAIYGDIKKRVAIIVDDIVTSGSTLLPPIQMVKEAGAKIIIAAASHHDFSADAADKLKASPIDKFFTTDTIALKDFHKFDKLVEVSIAEKIAKELEKLI